MSDFPEKENIEETTEPTLTPEEGSTVFSDPAEHKKTAVKQKKRLLPKVIAAVLAVAVLAGGTVAVIKLIPEREEDTSTPSIETISVLDMKSDDFKSVTVTNENGTFKLYSVEETETSDSSDTSSSEPTVNWYLDGYDREVIDSSAAGSIAGYAASLEAVREVTSKSAAECGLENPTVKATWLKTTARSFQYLWGASRPITREPMSSFPQRKKSILPKPTSKGISPLTR